MPDASEVKMMRDDGAPLESGEGGDAKEACGGATDRLTPPRT